MSQSRKRWLLVLVVIAAILAVDQGAKQLVIDNLAMGEAYEPIPALRTYFRITRSTNTGSAFGFLPEAGDLFLIIAVVVVIGMLFFYRRIPDEANLTRLAVGLICGGALGNALDRIRHEHVIDFIHYQIPGLISNVSNLADHAIVLGVIVIFIDSWRLDRKHKQQKEAELSTETANREQQSH